MAPKIGIVDASRISDANGLVLAAQHYLDRCENCGKSQDDPRFHQNGRCGSYKRVFVESGTEWKNANREESPC